MSFISSLKRESKLNRDVVFSLVKIYSSPNVDYERQVLDAVLSKGTHKWLAERSWLRSEDALKDLVDVGGEISSFISRTGLSNGLAIEDLVKSL